MAEMYVEDTEEDANTIVVDSEQSYWTKVYDLFETNYRITMCTCDASTTKRKIHIDNCEFDVSHVHEPQMKWCPILFLDAVVHTAMNNTVTSRQQACIDRRQFNQHRILQQSLEDAMVVDILPADIMASEQTEQNMGMLFSSSSRSENAILGTGIAASSSSTYDDDSGHSSINVSTHSKTSAFSDIGSGGEKKPPPMIHESKPLGNLFNKRGDTWSYRTWLSSWGSFAQLTTCLEYFAGSGKSAARHLLAGQSMVQQLQNIPYFRGGASSGGSNGGASTGASSGASSGGSNGGATSGGMDVDHTTTQATRASTFAEVFSYVKMSAQRRGSSSQRHSTAAASSASASGTKMEELPTRRSSRRQERKLYASSSYSSLDHKSSHNSSSSWNASGGGDAQPYEYDLDEVVSDGSEEDIIPTIASKRSRVTKLPQHDSTFASNDGGGKIGGTSNYAGSEGAGSSMMDKRPPTRGTSKRQKPLPSSSIQYSSGRSVAMNISLPTSSLPAPPTTSASSALRELHSSAIRDDSYSTSGLSQLEAHDTLLSQFGYHTNEVIYPFPLILTYDQLSFSPYPPTIVLLMQDGVLFDDIFDFEDPQHPSSSGENNNNKSSSHSHGSQE